MLFLEVLFGESQLSILYCRDQDILSFFTVAFIFYDGLQHQFTAQSIHIDIEHIISYIKHRDQTRITVANSKSLQPSMREFRFCSNHYELMSAQNSLATILILTRKCNTLSS